MSLLTCSSGNLEFGNIGLEWDVAGHNIPADKKFWHNWNNRNITLKADSEGENF